MGFDSYSEFLQLTGVVGVPLLLIAGAFIVWPAYARERRLAPPRHDGRRRHKRAS